MSRSLSWFNTEELSRALVRAGVAPPARFQRPLPPASNGQLSAAQLLFEETVEAAPARRSQVSELLLPPGATLQTRLKAFFSWVIHETGCQRIFVVDEEGLVLMEKNADPVLIAISSSFMNLLERVHSCLESKTQSSLAIDLEADQVLHLLQAETKLGRYALGFVVGQPVARGLSGKFKIALADVMNKDEDE